MKVGPVFFDSIHTEKISHRYHRNDTEISIRQWIFPVVLFGGIFILIARLFWMQIIQGDYYRQLSDSNRIRTIPIHAPRGVIFDRNSNPLVINTPGYRETINGKTRLLTQSEALDALAKGDTKLEIDSLRQYPCGLACADVVGYIGQISSNELKQPEYAQYSPQDVVGKMGVEQSYESVLKGIDGAKLVEVDSMGKVIRTLGQTDPLSGQNITLTIDENLQKEVAFAMKDVKKGAAIVSAPNGDILALYSAPSFDPNIFTMGKTYKTDKNNTYQNVAQVLLDGTSQPLLDRAISGTYPPGSTFKLVVAAAALQNNLIDSKFTITDPGLLKVGAFSFANWYYTDYGRTDGVVDVVKAIQRSNDIFFYTIGQMVGVDRLSGFAREFGLGSPLGIDLVGEASGLLPTKAWKQKVVGEQWYLGDDYHYGIGQGYLLTTPLQVNMWTQTIANGGTLYMPHILKVNKPIVKASGLLANTTTELLRQGMIEACQTGGVAWPLFNFTVYNPALKIDGRNFFTASSASGSGDLNQTGVAVACKTGTAQHGGATTLPDAWLTLFAPAYNPQIVVTVLSEDSGEGSNVAGPIAKQILQYYFGKK